MAVFHVALSDGRRIRPTKLMAITVIVACLLVVLAQHSVAGEIQTASDAPQPHTPEQSATFFRLPEGFRIELVASEPHLADPVATAFDPQGRIFVCEIPGYNLDGHYDIVELNKTGVLDKQVREIPASDEAIKRAEQGTYGTVKLLEDTDGDGRIDRSQIWADHLPACYGIVPARGGVIVLCAPQIIFLADRDGDGTAEVRETLFRGFGVGNMWTRINNPRWSPDNWIYAAMGHGMIGKIDGPQLPQPVSLGNTHFRFLPDGSRLEPVSGGKPGFGLAITDWGDRFLLTNAEHALYAMQLPHRYLARNPYFPAPDTVVNASDYNEVFPASRPHPWRLARSQQPEWIQYTGSHEATANGFFTAVSGPVIYRAAGFPDEYHGNLFVCECQQNLIHRCLLKRDGAGYRVERASGESQSEFLASPEGWFRPVNLTVGPDGSLYVVDMYREIIEDYSSIPRYLQQQYGLIKGGDRGRIWRIVYEDRPASFRGLNLARASVDELVHELSHPNAWHRQTAQRLLIERRAVPAADSLRRLARDGKSAQARLHALHTLAGLDALDAESVRIALDDVHYGVRRHALQLAEPWLDQDTEMLVNVLRRIDDPDDQVRLQVALTLGQTRDHRVVNALAELSTRFGSDTWMRAAIISSVAERADALLLAMLSDQKSSPGQIALVAPLAAVVGTRRDAAEIAQSLEAIAGLRGDHADQFQTQALQGLLDGLGRGKGQVTTDEELRRHAISLLSSPSGKVRLLALKLVGPLGFQDSPAVLTAFEAASKDAVNVDQSIELRRASIALLSSAPYDTLQPVATRLLDFRQPVELQLATVTALTSSNREEVASVLLADFEQRSPAVQKAILDAVFRRDNRLPALLEALEQETVLPASLGSLHRIRLLEHSDPTIRNRSKSLLVRRETDADFQKTFQRYHDALSGPRDVRRGAEAFKQHCSNCHRVNEEGHAVGPDLSATVNRADAALLSEILQPSDRITDGYSTYLVEDSSGQVYTGILAAETANSIMLRLEKGVEQSILRKDIDDIRASGKSMMPDGIVTTITPADMAHLFGFLRQSFGPALPTMVTLFDEDAAFVDLLTMGGGSAVMNDHDPFAGKLSLAVTPPRRYSAQIENWNYRIVERPGKDEYRYLRLAWKTIGGDGVMIELPSSGGWPPADSAARRYYSGKNTTSWNATQISETAPAEWTVVTLDLWSDCGEFTLSGIAPTAMGGMALFDRIQLLRRLDDPQRPTDDRPGVTAGR